MAPHDAAPLIELLHTYNIPFKTVQQRQQLDAMIIGNRMEMLYEVSIPPVQFELANGVMAASLGDATAGPNKDLDDYLPERLSTRWIVLGYLISCFPVMGLFVGISIIRGRKRLKNGEEVGTYDLSTINHGRAMIAVGVVMTVWLMYRKMSNQ